VHLGVAVETGVGQYHEAVVEIAAWRRVLHEER